MKIKAFYSIGADTVVLEVNEGEYIRLSAEGARTLASKLVFTAVEKEKSDEALNAWLNSSDEAACPTCGCQSVCGECFEG